MLERLDRSSLPWLRRWRSAANDEVLVTNLADGSKEIVREDVDEPIRLQTGDDGQPCYVCERMKSAMQDLYLFGAGHVGRALVHVLTGLPYRIRWFDERTEMFPLALPDNIIIEASADARRDVASARPGTIFLVMTHSHALDEELSERILQRADFAYFGLIGSTSKRRQFERRLAARGVAADRLAAMICPIGDGTTTGKEPGVIAVAVAAQLLQLRQRQAGAGALSSAPARTTGNASGAVSVIVPDATYRNCGEI